MVLRVGVASTSSLSENPVGAMSRVLKGWNKTYLYAGELENIENSRSVSSY